MYLDHFGLAREPFAIIPADGFFYGGAGRGAILDALIYVITHGEGVEGIIKVTGEEGSGKTTLFRELTERLPPNIETLTLTASLDWSAEGLLHVIASKLGSDKESGMVVTEVDEVQRALVRRYAAGRQVLILVDEAHCLSPETLEVLRVLYSHESSRNKLLQVVLLGQAELDTTLSLPSMHPLVAQITHHFVLQPFNLEALREYLVLRMRAAGYASQSPEVFSPEAVRQIALVSGGLIRQINVLADQSLLAVFTDNAATVGLQHVRGAIEDSGLEPAFTTRTVWPESSGSRVAGAAAMLVIIVIAVMAGGMNWRSSVPSPASDPGPAAGSAVGETTPPSGKTVTVLDMMAPQTPPPVSASILSAPSVPDRSTPVMASGKQPEEAALPAVPIVPATLGTTDTVSPAAVATAKGTASAIVPATSVRLEVSALKLAGYPLLKERIGATMAVSGTGITVQLFATDNIQNPRMERFLVRASNLVRLSDIYVYPVRKNGRAIYQVTYGIYPDRDQASLAVAGWPEKYKTAFQPEFVTLAELR